MRTGVIVGGLFGAPRTVEGIVEAVRLAWEAGLSSAWVPQVTDVDALVALAVAGREVPGIELGTAVVPTYPRHPTALAAQALTVQSALGEDRLVLGIGLSHRFFIEDMLGMSYERPACHMREYLEILVPLLQGRTVDITGEQLVARGYAVVVEDAPAPSVMLAALGPAMLRLAGSMTDGTITWMGGASVIRDYVVPTMFDAPREVGRRPLRVAVGLPVCVSDDADASRRWCREKFEMYRNIPAYRKMMRSRWEGGSRGRRHHRIGGGGASPARGAPRRGRHRSRGRRLRSARGPLSHARATRGLESRGGGDGLKVGWQAKPWR